MNRAGYKFDNLSILPAVVLLILVKQQKVSNDYLSSTPEPDMLRNGYFFKNLLFPFFVRGLLRDKSALNMQILAETLQIQCSNCHAGKTLLRFC